MRGLSILFLCFITIALVSATNGVLSLADSSETSISDQTRQPFNYLLPLEPKHDTALVAAPNGTIYLLDINSRKVHWSFNSGPPIYSSYQAIQNHEADELNASKRDNFFIDCGEDWELCIIRGGLKKMMDEFLRHTPNISADGGFRSGSKKTTVFLVDGKSGEVVQTVGSDDIPSLGDQTADAKQIIPRKDVEDQEKSNVVKSEAVEKLLYVLRTDYAFRYTSRTGKALWYLTIADIEASFQCLEVDNVSGGIFSEGEYKSDPESQSHCQMSPVVYRIRDHCSLEFSLMNGRLPDVHYTSRVPSLPSAEFIPLSEPSFQPIEPYKKGRVEFALPPPEYESFGIVDIYRGDSSEQNIGTDAEILAGSQFWSFCFYVVVLLIVPCLYYLGQKRIKLYDQGEDHKVQVVMSKKKKIRKSGTNKNSASAERSQKNILHDNPVGDTNGVAHSKKIEGSLQFTLLSHSDGRRIGKLFVSNKEIAKGSNGTIVLEGIYDGRPVAVKRLVQTHQDVALKEVQNLIASDQHQNIVRWYGVEHDQDFVYLSLERCTCSLHDLISSYSLSSQNLIVTEDQFPSSLNYFIGRSEEVIIEYDPDFKLWKTNGYPSHQMLKIIRDIVNGLSHLHEIGIIHRDLKPQNVLIVKERSLCAKISDMGISKRLAGDMTSLTKHATGHGSSGWQAPEQLHHERQTRAVDLFSLGCVLFFCITGGKHPFGDSLERDINIVNNQKDLFLIENIPEALDLISHLLDPDPELRPKAADVQGHPLLWSPEKRISFLRDASDRVELEDRESSSELLKTLESVGTVVFGGKWDDKLESAFINDIGRYRRYKFDGVRDLLRVIRNKLNHYRELPKEIQEILGPVPEGFECYFSHRFPKLLIQVYRVFQRYCAEEEFLLKYFKSIET